MSGLHEDFEDEPSPEERMPLYIEDVLGIKTPEESRKLQEFLRDCPKNRPTIEPKSLPVRKRPS
jgi:hypothetical protein